MSGARASRNVAGLWLLYARTNRRKPADLEPSHHRPPGVPYSGCVREGSGRQRVIVDPIPFLVCFAIALLLVWLWRRFKGSSGSDIHNRHPQQIIPNKCLSPPPNSDIKFRRNPRRYLP
jgi:hypothetical protein